VTRSFKVLQPTDSFKCVHYDCTLFVVRCLQRRRRYCASGECKQGIENRRRMVGKVPPIKARSFEPGNRRPHQPTEVLPV